MDEQFWIRRRCRRREHVEDFYMVGRLLGEGAFASVYAATRNSDGLPVALKYVAKAEGDLLLPGQDVSVPREVRLMGLVNQNMSHPNILRLYEWFDAPDHFVMVLERPVPCQDLIDFCLSQNNNMMDEHQARAVIDQLIHALLHCQHAGVFHRDVKPTNVLINTESLRVILIDFGCGTLWSDTPFRSFAGTTEFTPPEWFAKSLYQAGPATVWSLGVTLFTIVCGYLPFNPYDSQETMRVHFPTGLSSDIKDFMSRCLAVEVEDRATLEQLQQHPWLHPTCLEEGHILCLDRQQQGARRSPRLEPSEDEWLSDSHSSEDFFSACSSLWTYYSCQSTERTGVKRKKTCEELAELLGVSLGPSSRTRPAKRPRKAPEEPQKQSSEKKTGLREELEDRAMLEQLQQHPWLHPTCLEEGHILCLDRQQQGARRSPRLEPSEDEWLSDSHSSEDFFSACSSLWTYYNCQSTERTGVKRKKTCEELAELLGVSLGPSSRTRPAKRPRKAPEEPQKTGLKRRMGYEKQAVVLGPDSRTRPAKRQRKDQDGESLSSPPCGRVPAANQQGPEPSLPPSTQLADQTKAYPMLGCSGHGALVFAVYGPEGMFLCLVGDLQGCEHIVLLGLIKSR